MREGKDKLSHWRHPLGFNLNQRSGISCITLSNLYALRLSVLRFFFLHFNFISFFSSAVLSCVPLSGFSPRTKLLRRSVSITKRCSLRRFSFRVHMYICSKGSFKIATVIHRQLLRTREFIYESGRYPWPCIWLYSHRSLRLPFIFLISHKFNYLISFSFIALCILNSSYASSSTRCFVRTHAWFVHDCFKSR